MSPSELILQLRQDPKSITFIQVMELIAQHYVYHPSRFANGELINEAGTNEGSCKIFYFAQLQLLNVNETLHLFGEYYHKDVLANPTGTDHGNIRNFIKSGWQGIKFETFALAKK